jgi:hypothetical protein
MIKKSLKAGSIIVLLFSLLFFIGCSNGTTDTEPDTDTPPVVNPPDTPVVEPRVTRVTVLPGDIEVGRGESYTFTAQVEGVGAYDPTVTWTLDPVAAGEEPLLNTAISPRGKLTLDAGLHVGREVRVVATAGGVSGLAAVTVAPEGPYFTWEPGRVKVAVGSTIVATLGDPVYGYLRGYSHAEKDIRLRVGLLEEGVDYSVTYENGVSGARPTTTNPILQVVGTTTPYEGIVVALDASRITLLDPTLTGIIRVTMLPGAFFGSDRAELNPGRTSLVIEVSDHRAIDSLAGIDIYFDGNEGPMQGAHARKGIHSDPSNPIFTLIPPFTSLASHSVYWDYLSVAGNFAKQADKPLVASVTLKAATATYFLKSFDAAAISNSTSFNKGSPKVDNIEVSADGQTLTFDLTYDVYAKILKDTGATSGDIQLKDAPGFVANSYGFSPLVGAEPLTHRNSAPVLIFAENNYFDAKLEWGGTGIEAATETKPASFKTTRPNKLIAEAKITLTPKIGYTFEGTDLTFEDFTDGGRVFGDQTPTGTLVRGEGEGTLVLTLKYTVVEKVLGAADINAVNLEKLIARPITGKSVGITGIGESVFKATDASPYTAQVAWDPGMQTTYYRFNEADAATTFANITLTAKEGFIFDVSGGTSWGTLNAELASAVAIESFESDTITMPDAYTLKYRVCYDDAGTSYILNQITTLDGILAIDPIHGETAAPATGYLAVGASTEIDLAASTISWTGLAGASSDEWKYGLTTKATITLVAIPPYTFKDYERLDDTYFNDVGSETTKKTYIENYFANGIYAGNTGGAGKVELVDGPWAAGNDIVFTLQYTVKPAEIDITGLTITELGWWQTSEAVTTGNIIPIRFTSGGTPVNFTVKRLLWEGGTILPFDFDDDTKQPNGSTNVFEVGEVYKARLILVPDTGYVFSPALTTDGGNVFETFHVDITNLQGWGNTNTKVTPESIEVDIPASGADQGNLVITLEFAPTL